MEHLWAPWRMDYVAGTKSEGCVFCEAARPEAGAEQYVIYRGRHNLVILNRFPYNSGHVMVVPYAHLRGLTELSSVQLCEMMDVAQGVIEALGECMHPDGINLGMNLGRAAGAGIDDHVHLHLVPRWSGDTNFLTTVGDTRVVPQALADCAATVGPALRTIMARRNAGGAADGCA
jgi:ATP adenylyltransferase